MTAKLENASRRTVLADTSALYALADADDSYHDAARQFIHAQGHSLLILVTDATLLESLTLVKSRLGQAAAMQVLVAMRNSPRYRLTRLTDAEWFDTWATFERYGDKAWSPIDCSCLVVARHREIGEAFAFDRHFQQMASAGLACVPGRD